MVLGEAAQISQPWDAGTHKEQTMIYQQLNSQRFHMGTSAHDDWCEEKGALDTEAPGHDPKTHRARWVAETRTWDIRTNEEWEAELNPPIEEE